MIGDISRAYEAGRADRLAGYHPRPARAGERHRSFYDLGWWDCQQQLRGGWLQTDAFPHLRRVAAPYGPQAAYPVAGGAVGSPEPEQLALFATDRRGPPRAFQPTDPFMF